jgi:hypothetical protein
VLNNNQWNDPAPPFYATAGYDLTTGLGSPDADRFVAGLAASTVQFRFREGLGKFAGPFFVS